MPANNLGELLARAIAQDAIERSEEARTQMRETLDMAYTAFNHIYSTIRVAGPLEVEGAFIGYALKGQTTNGALIVPRPYFAACVAEAQCGAMLLGVFEPRTGWTFQHFEPASVVSA
jgi:hypothetical protein